MPSISIPIWKKAPFLRLVLPLMLGILLQWYFDYGLTQIIIAAACFIAALLLFRLLPLSMRFKLQALQGCLINLVIIAAGALLIYQKDIRHHQKWFGHFYQGNEYLVASVLEPPAEKNKTFKAEARVESLVSGDTGLPVKGKIILYFLKDPAAIPVQYGDKILFNKKLLAVQNSGNPGAFDYKQYLAFKQTFHHVFLKREDWMMLPEKQVSRFKEFLLDSRQKILNTLAENMGGDDDQLSIAEALLIGYTQDLDRDLIRAYSNTGVVHIIAISGMHLGLIYVILVWLFNRLPYVKRIRLLRAALILACLWMFTLLTGAGASILRSAIMFTCIVVGESFARRTSIYNSLAASAFILLCIDPFFLWDVGFQLSYLALLGIVIFQKPLYHLLFIKNFLLDKIWNLTAVSLAAQILTFPVCLYYFHQFPTIFLITNLLTVPLSGLILFVEIFLMAFSWLPPVAFWMGKLTWWLIWLMNKIILFFNGLPYALWDGIPASLISTILLYAFIGCLAFWILHKSKNAFRLSLLTLFVFILLRAYDKWDAANQQKIIVYNIPQRQAIDVVKGNKYQFIGDPLVNVDGLLQGFHMKPARTALQVVAGDEPAADEQNMRFIHFVNSTFLVLDSSFVYKPQPERIAIDMIILSKNTRVHIRQLAGVFNCRMYVFDASNSMWRIERWKRDCARLQLPCYSVPEKGAFIIDL